MKKSKQSIREILNRKKLAKWKKRKKEEVIKPKKEQKIAQKEIKKRFKKELKTKKVKVEEKIGEISRKKRMRNEIAILWLILLALTFRIGWIQFVDGENLQAMAYTQQTLDRSINPRRGTIYDRSRKNSFSSK